MVSAHPPLLLRRDCRGSWHGDAPPKSAAPARGGAGPVLLSVVSVLGELLASLAVHPRSTVGRLKTQIEGIEGTPADNQTLLLGGRALPDDLRIDCLGGLGPGAALTLVRCTPLLRGGLSHADLRRLVEEEGPLERAIDAYTADPCYDAGEVAAIVSAVSRALLPSAPEIAEDVLGKLPLDLLDPDAGQCAEDVLDAKWSAHDAASECSTEETPRFAAWPSSDSAPSPEPRAAPAAVDYFDIADTEGSSLQERRERFTSCVRAALGMIQLAVSERDARPCHGRPGTAACAEPLQYRW